MTEQPKTVRSAVAEKRAQSPAYGRVQAARDSFARILPSHVDADQFIAVLLGVLQRDDKLRAAAEANPNSFIIAAAECARLGLVAGETFHLVPFWNAERKVHEITGIIDYKGEIDLIYRGGAVESVHAEVVRANDRFAWKPGMVIPEHTVLANDHGQIGLVDEKQRGILTGVYAYARLRGGGTSRVVVMTVSEVLKHRDVSKTDKFWGPEWPDEGPWTPAMWLKTAIHALPTWVPSSPEYVTELWRAAAAISSAPPAIQAPSEPWQHMPPEVTSTVRGAVEAARSSAKGAARTRQGQREEKQGEPDDKAEATQP